MTGYTSAKEFFKEEWGTAFTKATLHEEGGLLELSMQDIYETMEKYHKSKTNKVTRVEVIDENGRSYTNWNCKAVELSFQDDNRTLKVFIDK